MYENQKFLFIIPEIIEIIIVWISKIILSDNGCFININKVLKKNNKYNIIDWKISRNSLIKILILEINDKYEYFFLKF